jgi:hypothetical protein
MAPQKLYRYLVYLVFLASALYITIGCKKATSGNTEPIPEPVPHAKKLVKIEEGIQDSTTFEYNEDGTLKRVMAVYQTGSTMETYSWTISYNAGKKIKEMVSNRGTTIGFFYKNGLLNIKENRTNGILNYTQTFTYENGRLSKLAVWHPGGTGMEVVSEVTYTYYTNHPGNVKEAFHRELNPATGQLQNSMMEKAETYDNKINPYSLLGDFGFGFFYNINTRNPVNEVIYDYRNGDYYVARNTTNNYTYDAAGYPVINRQTIALAGQQPVTTVIKYTYR